MIQTKTIDIDSQAYLNKLAGARETALAFVNQTRVHRIMHKNHERKTERKDTSMKYISFTLINRIYKARNTSTSIPVISTSDARSGQTRLITDVVSGMGQKCMSICSLRDMGSLG